jgi:hypothetical protein
LEYECPDPFPRVRMCPAGIGIDGAFCLLGYILLHAQLDPWGPYIIYYFHSYFQGWNFISPMTLEDFWKWRETLHLWIADPSYGTEGMKANFDGLAMRRRDDNYIPTIRRINEYFGIP